MYSRSISGLTKAGNRRRRKADPFKTHLGKGWMPGLKGKSNSGGRK
tara:strand:+ start:109 stop:246 length:138 start_codon:yes stop_codon:yes gene_type:complete